MRYCGVRTIGAGGAMVRRALMVLVLVVTCLAPAGVAAPEADGAGQLRCNGQVQLCDRRFDRVALAGAHNAMAYPGSGFQSTYQGRSIRDQLGGGVRALLLDVYQGTPNGAQVCTDPTPLKVAQLTREIGKAGVDRLIALRDSMCPPAGGPTSALYLCHGFCETGATLLADELREVRDFLREHPREVVALVLEDYADAADIADAFDDAGLAHQALRHRPGTRWPTLQTMIRSGKRLVVFSQRQGGTPRWLLPAFEEMQDTPYEFRSVDEFSCAPNRGPATAPLLLVNHWLSTPDGAATAPTVNSRDQLLARVAQCAAERRMVPNILAVNFAETGDLVDVVDAINRSDVPSASGTR